MLRQIFVSLAIFFNLVYLVHADLAHVPRFASIKNSKMNSRSGPGFDYPVVWHYWRKNMPVEIIEEYEQWRKIKDKDGDISWVYQFLLSNSRSAIIQTQDKDENGLIAIYSKPDSKSRVLSRAQEGVIAKVTSCDGRWCYLNFGKVSGYLEQNKLWGVYKDEVISN